ncbi:MAG: MFS transporter, partial [Pseudorhodoplanes sp.]
SRLADGGPTEIAFFFAIFGIMNLVGNVAVTRIVMGLGASLTSLVSIVMIVLGAVIWIVGVGSLHVMALAFAAWGLGFTAFFSIQQARLIFAAPELAGASIALNSSSIYIGQALGSGLGGILFARELFNALGYAALAIIASTLLIWFVTRPRGAGQLRE